MEIRVIEELNEKHINPQMAREKIQLLDGIWKCNGQDILVPYPPESELSLYAAREEVLADSWDGKLTYEVEFTLPENFSLPRVRLHFGAVDQICDVYVNEQWVGHHEGGYLAFAFDITEQLQTKQAAEKDSTKVQHKLRVEVEDKLCHAYPYGKQRQDRGGMWYTHVSGIWKSVWLENVPELYVSQWQIDSDLQGVTCKATMNTGVCYEKRVVVEDGSYWSPDNPKLYPIEADVEGDCFSSYFALREITVESRNGVSRVCLNGQPIFMHGVLDQGYWPDGIYTPKSREKYTEDILAMKELGFNMLRKHCKVEEPQFYFACDKLGMLVCQDMVHSGSYDYWFDTIFPTIQMKRRKDTIRFNPSGIHRQPFSAWKDLYDDDFRRNFFIEHCKDTIQEVRNHPCVVMYTIFNEGWGQFDSDRIYDILKAMDPSRLFDSTSGWFAQKKSDFDTEHVYFWHKQLKPKKRPMFLKECGGYSLPIANHLWKSKRRYGYGACKNKEELTKQICHLYDTMVIPAIEKGLCGCIYTQLSDVEDEINGMYTYDRKECKVIKGQMQEIALKIKKIMK